MNKFNALMVALLTTVIHLAQAVIITALWNLTVPELFHAPYLDYQQALALYFIVKLIHAPILKVGISHEQ